MQIKKILFPTNFEELSFPTVEALYSMKDAGLEEIVFLFVIDRDEVAYNLITGFDKELANELRESARLRFAEWGKELEKQGIASKAVVEIGTPEGKILQVAEEEGVDLIVAGRRRHMAADAIYLSGTTMGVLRRSVLPVLVYRHYGEGGKDNPHRHIVFTTDFSESSACAFDYIKRLKGLTQKVEIVHVMTERDFRKHTPEEVAEEEKRCLADMEVMAAELRGMGIEADTHVLAGETSTEAIGCSQDNHATMIVMGTTGKHGLRETWLGSASHRVVERASVSVTLAPCRVCGEYEPECKI